MNCTIIKIIKSLLFSLLLISVVGCKKADKKKELPKEEENEIVKIHPNILSTKTKKQNDVTPKKKSVVAYEHDLKLYNNSYLLQISPKIDTSSVNTNFEIVLTQKKETVFKVLVNLDSLALKTRAVDIAKEVKQPLDFKVYQIKKIVYHGVRGNNLFFQGTLVSKTNNKNVLKTFFFIQYLNKKDRGKLIIQGVNKKGYGRNKGDEFHSLRNRKIIYLTKEGESQRKQIINKINNFLSENNYSNEAYTTNADTLTIKRKITVNGERQYNYLKTPLYKLADVGYYRSENKITLYMNSKCIEFIRYKQNNVKGGQVTLTFTLDNSKTKELFKLFKELKEFNVE